METIAYRINDFSRVIGIGRSKIYELIHSGKLHAVHVGGRTLIPASEGKRLIEGDLK